MPQSWWNLPGPSRFVNRISADLQEGKNVFVCLPEHAPSGLSRAVRYAVEETETIPWRTLDLSEEESLLPTDLLFSKFATGHRPDDLRNASTFADQSDLSGGIIWIQGIDHDPWHDWKTFFSDYGHACRSVPLIKRTVFCVLLVGAIALDPPTEDVCVACHYWRNTVSAFDALLYATQCFQDRVMPRLQHRVAINVTANLSLWDPTVTECLADEKFENILRPASLLKSLAIERGWDGQCPSDEGTAWATGLTNRYEGENRRHSACLVFDSSDREIERRLWSAEVGIMLPFVEEQRQAILSQIGPVLQLPFYTKTGEAISDLHDLEIGYIYSQVFENGLRVDPKLKKLIQTLRQIRNHLSHLETLAPDVFAREEISEL